MEAPVEKPMAVSGSGGSVARQPEKSVTPRKSPHRRSASCPWAIGIIIRAAIVYLVSLS